jgi:hypothetical protein
MKEEVVQDLLAIKDELLAPFAGLTGIADKFIDQYNKVFSVVKKIKDAYSALKKGYVRPLYAYVLPICVQCNIFIPHQTALYSIIWIPLLSFCMYFDIDIYM